MQHTKAVVLLVISSFFLHAKSLECCRCGFDDPKCRDHYHFTNKTESCGGICYKIKATMDGAKEQTKRGCVNNEMACNQLRVDLENGMEIRNFECFVCNKTKCNSTNHVTITTSYIMFLLLLALFI